MARDDLGRWVAGTGQAGGRSCEARALAELSPRAVSG